MNDLISVHELPLIHQSIKKFTITAGSIIALKGDNGIGKSTLIRSLAGLIPQAKSYITFHTTRIGYCPESPTLPQFLTAYEFLYYCQKLTIDKLSNESLHDYLFNISIKNSQKIYTLSKGMRQRLACAQAFLSNPDIIFLDEPFDGLDQVSKKSIEHLISSKKFHQTIFYSTHENLIDQTTHEYLLDKNGLHKKN